MDVERIYENRIPGQMDVERVQKCFEIKAADASLQENRISVVPSVMGAIDECGDVIFPGAFGKVVKQFLTEGFVADTHEWDWEHICAYPLSLEEDGNLLKSEAQFHSTPDAQLVRTKCMERLRAGLSVGASIGFSVYGKGRAMFDNGEALLEYAKEIGADLKLFDTKGIAAYPDWCRAITSIDRLYEYSIVPVPMMRMAQVMDAKTSGPFDLAQKAVSGSTNLPLAARDMAWDASAADKRVREWAGATDAPNAKYRRAFFWYDAENAENFTAYKLQFADVVDGSLKAVPRGIMACAGGHGVDATVGLSDSDKAAIKAKINRYYARMREAFNDDTMMSPFEMEGGKSILPVTEREFEAFLREAGYSRKHAKTITLHGFKSLLRDAEGDPDDEETATEPEAAPEASETPAPEAKTLTPLTPPAPISIEPEISPILRARLIYQASQEWRRFLELTQGAK